MVRHFHGEILACFAAPYLARDAAGRREMAEAARPLVERYLTDRVRAALPPRLRLRAHCLAAGLLDELTGIIRADTGTANRTGRPRTSTRTAGCTPATRISATPATGCRTPATTSPTGSS